jgi:hypothetical protein
MAVKHSPTGVVHKGQKGSLTRCGFDTKKKHPIGLTPIVKSRVTKTVVKIKVY